jgi:hypothetical protein
MDWSEPAHLQQAGQASGIASIGLYRRRFQGAEVICTTVYQFPELSDAAKEKARSWYRELGPHDDWWDAVYEDFERVCEILGIRLKTTPVRLMGGGTRAKPCIWFSGFWSQGDGADTRSPPAKQRCIMARSLAPKRVVTSGAFRTACTSSLDRCWTSLFSQRFVGIARICAT